MLLAIDTATQYTSLALFDGNSLIGEHTWRSDHHHTTQLAPAVHDLMARTGIAMADLSALAVCTGPGSFTGLRIGVALAKGIAGGRGLPLVGVSSMDVLAAGQPQMNGSLVTIVEAGRGRIITGRYQWRKPRWVSRGELRLMHWDELFASIDGSAYLTGEIDTAGIAAFEAAQAQGLPVVLMPGSVRLRRAGFLAEEAWAQLVGGDPLDFDAAKVLPVYVRTEGTPA
jgi:tRNA threonylcarbamoyladenosine biosynthesis protein TsaB